MTAAAEWLAKHGKKKAERHSSPRAAHFRVGIYADRISLSARNRLAVVLPSSFRLREAPDLVEQARMVKDAQEIQRIRAAVLMGADLLIRHLTAIRPGVMETQVAAEMEYAARRAGAEAMSFSTIVAAGSVRPCPMAGPPRTEIPAKGFVVCDFGVILSRLLFRHDPHRVRGSSVRGSARSLSSGKGGAAGRVDAVRPGVSVAKLMGQPAN